MTQHKETKLVALKLPGILRRKGLTLTCGFILFLFACTPFAATKSPLQVQPTNTKVEAVTPIVTQTLVPSPTIVVTPSLEATPTKNPNSLTYKNEAGQEVTVGLTIHEYTNRNGEITKMVEVPDDRAFFKYLADKLQWNPPMSSGPGSAMDALATELALGPGGYKELLAKLDIGWPPPRSSNPGVMAFPGEHTTSMLIFVNGFDGGTIGGGRLPDGNIEYIFVNVDPEIIKMPRYSPESPTYQYILELATERPGQ